MIILAINDVAQVEHSGSYAEERRRFNQICRDWQNFTDGVNADKNPDISAAFHRNTDTMVFRSINHGQEATIIVTLVSDPADISKRWEFDDYEVQNSQGGTTHIHGWHLK